MMSDFNLYSVNWKDGMLITRKHLAQQERYFEDLSRWYAAGQSDSYGLVRRSQSGKPALALNTALNGNIISVEVVRCQAVTPDGSFIEINESTQPVVRAKAEVSEATIPVFIGVAGAKKKEVGEPDPGEETPRMPFLAYDYFLSLGERPAASETSTIQIAQLKVEGGELVESPDFLPPCMNVFADDRLYKTATDFRNRLETMLQLASRAYIALASDDAMKEEVSGLRVAFREATEQIVYLLASSLDGLVVSRNAVHPIQFVIAFKRLFRVFATSLNLHPGMKDYLNEKLFSKALKIELRAFMAKLDGFLLDDYNHQDIGGHIKAIDENLQILRKIMDYLAQLKGDQLGPQAVATDMLTYGGKTYRVVEYTGSRLEQVADMSYLTIDFAQNKPVSDIVVLMGKDMFSTGEWATMNMRLGLNQARALGETDPLDYDPVAFGNKVALHPRDLMESPAVSQITLMFRGAGDPQRLNEIAKMDLQIYAI